jgi:hypothetical protein
MRRRPWALLGYGSLAGMLLRATVATRADEWPINLLAFVAGLALIVDARRTGPRPPE